MDISSVSIDPTVSSSTAATPPDTTPIPTNPRPPAAVSLIDSAAIQPQYLDAAIQSLY